MPSCPKAAAKSSGASILAAVAYQKSPSLIVPTEALATSTSPEAARRAPGQVVAAGNGDHRADSRPVDPDGSKQRTEPSPRR
jgi:hypothetical protein